MQSRWRTLVLTLLAMRALSPTGAAEGWPTAGWPSASPAELGLDPALLEKLHAEFAAGTHGYVDGMLVVRGGRIVFERSYRHDYVRLFEGRDPQRGPYNYYDPDWHPFYEKSDLHTMQSVSKSVTSALVGIAIGRGELPGVEVPVARYFAGFALGADPRQARITLRDLLTMTAGIEWDESSVAYTDPKNSCAAMEQSRDWVQFVLRQPMAEEPGRTFVYNSGVTMLLAQILKQATGKSLEDYAVEHLFGPLGIERFYWKRTPTGLADAEGGLYLAPRDLAKLGYLYLKGGVWDGKRLLPEAWVADSTAPQVATSKAGGRTHRYGYQWWVIPGPDATSFPAYAARGYGGQLLIVAPALDLVLVYTGWNIYDKPSLSPLLALDRVVAAVTGH